LITWYFSAGSNFSIVEVNVIIIPRVISLRELVRAAR